MQETIRSQKDIELFLKLKEHPLIVQSAREIEQLTSQSAEESTRRHLLKSSIKLSKAVSPELYDISQACIEKLGVEMPLDLYVYSSSDFNAACFKPENGRLHIMFSSSLLEAFNADELKFVLGHELGHHIYRHHDIPIGFILNRSNKPDPELALELFEWSRYAEISADRAGAVCVDDFHHVASSMFKLSSGISEFGFINFNLKAYLEQIDELIHVERSSNNSKDTQDWFSTHPFSPLRVKALDFFFRSELLGKQELSTPKLESAVEETLNLMEPNYLAGQTPEDRSLRELFIAQAVTLSASDGDFSENEQNLVNKFLDHSVEIKKINVEKIKNDLPRRIKKVNETNTSTQKHRLIRDLILIAGVDNQIANNEEQTLIKLCSELKIDTSIVDKALRPNLFID